MSNGLTRRDAGPSVIPGPAALEFGAAAMTTAVVMANTQFSVQSNQLMTQTDLGPLQASSSIGMTGGNFTQERATNINFGPLGSEYRADGSSIGLGGMSAHREVRSNVFGLTTTDRSAINVSGHGIQYHEQFSVGGRQLVNLNLDTASCSCGIGQCLRGVGSYMGNGLKAFGNCAISLIKKVPWEKVVQGVCWAVKGIIGVIGFFCKK